MVSRAALERLIPESGQAYDVVVAGGGPAGIGAAVAAARNGAKTLLLEARSFFGGVAGVAPWMPMNRLLLNGGPRGGVLDLFVEKVKAHGSDAYTAGRHNSVDGDGLDIHPEFLKLAIFELLEENGVHYRLHSPVTGVLMDGDRVTGVVVTGKGRKHEFPARVVVDASGDGDVAYLAGAEMVEGREEDGRHMPSTLLFTLANVDVDRLLEYWQDSRQEFRALIQAAAREGYSVAPWYSFDRTTLPGVVGVNNGALIDIGEIDATRPRDMTIADRLGLEVAHDFVRLARDKRIPGLENCYLLSTGATVGVRDTRRIVGEYVLTLEDAQTGPEFEDVVARKYGAIDAVQLFQGRMKSGFAYPYRCLLPKRIDNLLVAGRCGSATFLGHAAGKSMGNMMEIGQAAGAAAALCSQKDIAPRQLDVKELQAVLVSMGAKLWPETV